MTTDSSEVCSFGPFEFDASDRQLYRNGAVVQLTPKAADLLFALLKQAGRVIRKDDLFTEVWPDTAVADGTLTFHVHLIRQALGDSAASPKYIETIPKRGYRFICPVRRLTANEGADQRIEIGAEVERDSPSPQADRPGVPGRWRRRLAAAAGVLVALGAPAITVLVGLLIAVALVAPGPWNAPPIRVARITRLTHDGKDKSSLTPFDTNRLLVKNILGQRVFRTDSATFAADNPLDSYAVLDVSVTRGEALATRPGDRGAERGLWAVRVDGTGARRIGMAQTDEYAAWSHDGQHIAYLDRHNVYVTDAIGAAMKIAATFTGEVASPVWLLDDRSIRVTVSNSSDRRVSSNLYDVDMSGSDPRVVLPYQPAPWNCCGGWISQSSDYIFESGSTVTRELWILTAARTGFRRQSQIRKLTPDGGGVQYSSPVPSSDGKRVYAIGSWSPRLSVYDEQRGEFFPYLGGIPVFAVHFSPDRQWVVYINNYDFTLWRARADGSEARQLTFQPWYVDAVAWSPDSRHLAVRARAGDQHTKVHVLAASGGTLIPLDNRDVEQGSPTWSPDGNRIAFGDVPEVYGRATGTERIHVYDLATRQTTDVPGSEGLWSSRWSPDGRYLAATRIADRAVMLFTVATGQWRELTRARVDDLVWTSDSRYLYCDPDSTPRWARRIRLADGQVEAFLDLSTENIGHAGAGLTLDGRPLFLRNATDLFALELERR